MAFIRGAYEIHIDATQKSEPIDSVLIFDSVFFCIGVTGVILETVCCLMCIQCNDALRICSKIRRLKEGQDTVPKENALHLYLNISFYFHTQCHEECRQKFSNSQSFQFLPAAHVYEQANKYKILLPLRGSGNHAMYKFENIVSDHFTAYSTSMAVPNGSVDTITWLLDLSIIKGIRFRNVLPVVTVRSFVVVVVKAIPLSYLKNEQRLSAIGSDYIFR